MIQDTKSVYNILKAINGKLRTPKIAGFYDMVDFLKLKRQGYYIDKLPLDTSPLSSNCLISSLYRQKLLLL